MANRTFYVDVAAAANPSLRDRTPIARKNGEFKVLRRYHLLRKRVEELQSEIKRTNRFVSPYGANRLYSMVINSIVESGENIDHPVSVVFGKFRELMSDPSTIRNNQTAWDRFNQKTPRNENTHLTAFPRYIYNLEVLQRLGGDHPYGFKLAQLGACIDINFDAAGMILVKLRTGIPNGAEVRPINSTRKRKSGKTVSCVPAGMMFDSYDIELVSNSENDELMA